MKRLVLLAGLLASPLALAHAPFLECRALGAQQVRCLGGFTDGSAAAGVMIKVYAADGGLLFSAPLGADSSLVFERPQAHFHVLFDVGPGYRAEVDSRDIAGL
ncbi:MAG: hypothetical protein GAK45_01897 [Pseudomonas citronellolis]|nr:MAG: hypothetical protein GAK45_01897 [Pseudomonas citronellolis]